MIVANLKYSHDNDSSSLYAYDRLFPTSAPVVWLRGEEGSSSESRLRLKRERPPVSFPSDDNPLMMRSWATGKRRSAPCDSTLIGMLRHCAHHVNPEVSGILRSAA